MPFLPSGIMQNKDNESQPKAGNAVAEGIIAKAFKCGLDPIDEKSTPGSRQNIHPFFSIGM